MKWFRILRNKMFYQLGFTLVNTRNNFKVFIFKVDDCTFTSNHNRTKDYSLDDENWRLFDYGLDQQEFLKTNFKRIRRTK